MRVDDDEDVIMLQIFNFENSRINIFIDELDDDRKKTLNMFVVIMSTILICTFVWFAFSITYNLDFALDAQFRFLDSFENYRVVFRSRMFINKAKKII